VCLSQAAATVSHDPGATYDLRQPASSLHEKESREPSEEHFNLVLCFGINI